MNTKKTLMEVEVSEVETLSKKLCLAPPAYPSTFRYIDDFTEKHHVLNNVHEHKWQVMKDGKKESFDFHRYSLDANLIGVIKAFTLDYFSKHTIASTLIFVSGLHNLPLNVLIEALEKNPDSVRPFWDNLRAKSYSATTLGGLKALLRFASEKRLGNWTPLYLPFISSSLPIPTRDKYAAARAGDVFLSVDEEAMLVRWIEEKAINASTLSRSDLNDAAIIICNYQFAMRPKQIGILRRRDCRVLQSAPDLGVAVHLTFRMIKQRSEEKARTPLVRKVKQAWAPLFAELYSRGKNESGEAHLFGHTTAAGVTQRIVQLLFDILQSKRTATDVRHSGAMRQVDAGASAEDLAEFMGHSSLESGLVYFDTSATQTQRVNEALGISETYQRLSKLGRERFITLEELGELKGEQQIAGVPHGISIAGIGGCATGQPSCPYNPITACYGCHKFMPVSNISIHKQVLADFRGVITLFFGASRGATESPAYLQLKRTVSEVTAVIDQLECPDE